MALTIHVHGLEGLTLVSPEDPAFDEIARPLLGRIATLALTLKPLLVIVSNASAQPVVSFSKTWRITHADGRVTEIRDHTSFPHAVCGDGPISRDPAGVAPGARRIEAKGLVIHGWGDLDEYYDQFLPQFVTEKDQMLADAVDLRIELNAAIFADGTLVGPDDGSWLSELFSTYVRAKQDWYRIIIEALDRGSAVADAFRPLDEFLAEQRERMRSGRRPIRRNPAEIWTQQAAAEANGWRRKYADEDIPRLLEDAIRLEPFVIRRVPLR